MLTIEQDIICSMKDGHWIHGSWLQKSSGLQSLAKESKQKQRKTRNFTKKVKNALDIRFVIDCLGLALKKKRCIITHVITELEHKHRTGFLSHYITANSAVFTSGTTDPGESVHAEYLKICSATRFFSGRLMKISMTANLNDTIWLCFGIHLNLKNVNVQLHLSKENNIYHPFFGLEGKRTKALVKMWIVLSSVQQWTL